MRLLFQMWRAMREFRRLELEEKIKRNNIFQHRQRSFVWVPRYQLSIALHASLFFKFMLNDFFGVGKKEERLENMEKSIHYIDERVEGIIDNLIEDDFLETEMREWEPDPGQVVAVTLDANGKVKNPIYQEKLKMTPRGRVFADSPIAIANYIREKVGLGWPTLFKLVVILVLIAVVLVGIFMGNVEVSEIYKMAIDKIKNL